MWPGVACRQRSCATWFSQHWMRRDGCGSPLASFAGGQIDRQTTAGSTSSPRPDQAFRGCVSVAGLFSLSWLRRNSRRGCGVSLASDEFATSRGAGSVRWHVEPPALPTLVNSQTLWAWGHESRTIRPHSNSAPAHLHHSLSSPKSGHAGSEFATLLGALRGRTTRTWIPGRRAAGCAG